MSRSILALRPDVAVKAGEWFRLCCAKGVIPLMYETHRTDARQLQLWQIGRDANGKRIPGKKVVTYVKQGGAHQERRAFDAAPFDEDQGYPWPMKLDWRPFDSRADEREFKRTGRLGLLDREWRVMVQAAEKLGFTWGGRWTRFRDYCHFELEEP